jgi:hypothetical protein
MRIIFFKKDIIFFITMQEQFECRKDKTKRKERIILITIPLDSLLFIFLTDLWWHEEGSCTLKHIFLKLKASQLFQNSYCYQSRPDKQPFKQFTAMKCLRSQNFIGEVLNESASLLIPLPFHCSFPSASISDDSEVQETSVLSDSICVCASVSEPTAT